MDLDETKEPSTINSEFRAQFELGLMNKPFKTKIADPCILNIKYI